MQLSADQKSALTTGRPPLLRATALSRRSSLALSPASLAKFTPAVRSEIEIGTSIVPFMYSKPAESFVWRSLTNLTRLLADTRDPIFWDQAIWEDIDSPSPEKIRSLTDLFEHAPTQENQISVLLGMAHIAAASPQLAVEFLESISEDKTNIEAAEWSTLLLRELVSTSADDSSILNEAVSAREFNYDKSKRFDVVLPLMFAGYAYTGIGPTVKKTVISPLWFYRIFGRANALVRLDTITSDLVIEKRMEGVNPDGSPHFETFPFSGETEIVDKNVKFHNYWAELSRPFYSSGRTGYVGEGDHVVGGVRMSFQRVAETCAPDRYAVDAGNLVESTRGIFFGHGHVDVKLLLRNRFDLQPGNFQLCNSTNPITKEPANTQFFGTFYGKVSDWDGDGRLDFNNLPVHSSTSGVVDYLGDGTLEPSPLRPQDWRI